jgi:hypothetical protein
MRIGAHVALLCLTALGCSSAPVPARISSDHFDKRNVITYEEIRAARTPGSNAWDLIAQARPTFLRSRGATSFRDPTPVRAVIYLDGILYGKLESLRSLNIEEIREIEFITAGDATTRFGSDHLGGAILIRTR